ncbi:hypothetical protein ACJX0J_012726, partial [Zea mays]
MCIRDISELWAREYLSYIHYTTNSLKHHGYGTELYVEYVEVKLIHHTHNIRTKKPDIMSKEDLPTTKEPIREQIVRDNPVFLEAHENCHEAALIPMTISYGSKGFSFKSYLLVISFIVNIFNEVSDDKSILCSIHQIKSCLNYVLKIILSSGIVILSCGFISGVEGAQDEV